MPTKYAMIKTDTIRGERKYTVEFKMSNDFRRWPYRETHARHDSRKAAVAAAEASGAIVLRRWCDATLTAEEEAAQYSH